MDNLRELLGIRRMDRILNARIRDLCGVKKGLDERIDESVLRWFGHPGWKHLTRGLDYQPQRRTQGAG